MDYNHNMEQWGTKNLELRSLEVKSAEAAKGRILQVTLVTLTQEPLIVLKVSIHIELNEVAPIAEFPR